MTSPVDRLSTAMADRYAIERELGAGGMATVYLAEDVRHHRKVAIKVLHPELSAVLGPERFLKEIELTANLQHPHILPLFDSGNADGLLFYVMPYVEGETLRGRLEREQQLPIADALRIASEVADALEYAHKRGVVHRDVKPENILLHDGRPLVADFGIALAVQQAGGSRMTQTGMSLGTPQYMAPEQAMGDKSVDHRADIYALGAITYEMLTGEPPFTGPNSQAIVAKVLTTDPTSLQVKRRSIPPQVSEAVLTALEKIPADRFSSAGEFARALQGEPATVSTRPARTGAGRAATRSPWTARLRDPLSLALAAMTIAALVFGALQWRAAHNPTPQPVVRFAMTVPAGVTITSGFQTTAGVSPDGRTVAFIAREGTGTEKLFVRTLNDAAVTPLAGTDGAFVVFFSPDGEWVAFVETGRLKKVRITGGTPVLLTEATGLVGSGSWSSSDEIILTMGNGKLAVIPDGGGTPRPLCRSGDAANVLYETNPLALADGKTVLYSSWSTQGVTSARLAVASLASGECRLVDLPLVRPLGFVDDAIVYVTEAGAVMATPFDLGKRRATGSPRPLLSDIEVNQTSGGAQATLSENGTLVYQSTSPPARLVFSDLHGIARPLVDVPRRYSYPRYSPDGRKIAVAVSSPGQRDVWVLDVADGTATRLTTDGALNERPEWTPDGTRVLYRTAKERRSSLWWRAADLSERERPVLSNVADDYYEGVITPDGRAIVYQRDTSGSDVMYRMLSGDTTERAIANTEFNEAMARVSPNGRWVAYVTDESGAQQVVVQPFPGPGARTQVSIDGGREPVWSRDGKRLLYRDNQNFIAANVSAEGSFSIISREVLFRDEFVSSPLPHANYDVAPDGNHLLLLRATEPSQLVIVHNWRDEVRAQLRGARR
ncbi:hypothetical protein BH23GEM2_BH23GEM2_17170 [soil metagenome]